MAKCKIHPGKDAVPGTIFGNYYCEKCTEQIKAAQLKVDGHVTPRDCFIWFVDGKTGWQNIDDDRRNTGCAHWVAHELGITDTISNVCARGFNIRVPDLISGFRQIDRKTEAVRAGDVWVDARRRHCGLVIRVEDEGKKILIRHCSSGQGSVVENYFPSYLKDGDFYRK